MTPSSWFNPIKKKLREGRPVIAGTLTVNSVELAAQMAGFGFDFLWIEMEHSPITLATLREMVLATRGLPTLPFARVPVNELWTAKQVLDMGVSGVLFPFTSSPELARQAVAACRYPPHGGRGSGAGLAKLCWPDDPQRSYYDSADENVAVIVVVEEARALPHIDEIAATPGIDAIFIGTSDLSFSLGLRGEQEHPTLDEAVAKIADAARRHGKALGRPGPTPAHVKRYIEQGFQLFQGPTEVGLLTSGAKSYLGAL
jgi:2-keto-3-deoxy-L-rhamnonate aldolase RhmA